MSSHKMNVDMDDIAKAVMADNQHLVVSLVSKGVDVSGENKRITGLMAAAMRGNEKMMRFLLKRGARVDVKYTGDSDRQALQFATMAGEAGCVRILIEEGRADVHAVDAKGYTPLHTMVAGSGLHHDPARLDATARVLLAAGARVNTRNDDGATALQGACMFGDTDIVKLLLAAGADVEVADRFDISPLFAAAAKGHADVVRVLLEAGANHSTLTRSGKLSPLHAAIYCDSVAVAKLLLDAGAAIEGPPGCEVSPAEYAVRQGSHNVLKELAKRGADVSAKAKWTRSVELVRAARAGAFDRVRTMLAAAASGAAPVDVNCRDTEGRTTLHHACEYGLPDTVRLLIAAGANVNAPQAAAMLDCSQTPLHVAVEVGHTEIVMLLLDAGADANARSGTNSNHTPLLTAAAVGDTAIASLLLAAGADPALTDSTGRTALDVARLSSRTRAVAALITSALADKASKAAKAADAVPPDPSVDRCSAPGCGKPADMVCGSCKATRYCNQDCQRAHWRAGHKQECAALKAAAEVGKA